MPNPEHSRYTKWEDVQATSDLVDEYVVKLKKGDISTIQFENDFAGNPVALWRMSRLVKLQLQNVLDEKPGSFTQRSKKRTKDILEALSLITPPSPPGPTPPAPVAP